MKPPPAIRTPKPDRPAPLGTCDRPIDLHLSGGSVPCGGPIKSGCPFVAQYPECEYEPTKENP